MILLIMHSTVQILSSPKVAILGYASNISPEKVIELTNQKRLENGVGAVVYNESLAKAAQQKAADMLEQDYWAHVAPDGTEPWDFFRAVGYTYRFAGENLARDFMNPETAVEAWMASPSHRENMLAGKYTEIGIAVAEGDLNGKDTTLVVQFFGTPSGAAPVIPEVAAEEVSQQIAPEQIVEINAENMLLEQPVPAPAVVNTGSAVEPAIAINDFDLMRAITVGIVGITVLVLGIDVLAISKRGITRVGGKAFAHLSFMIVILIILIVVRGGQIL
jgi:hypothetical protein